MDEFERVKLLVSVRKLTEREDTSYLLKTPIQI